MIMKYFFQKMMYCCIIVTLIQAKNNIFKNTPISIFRVNNNYPVYVAPTLSGLAISSLYCGLCLSIHYNNYSYIRMVHMYQCTLY